MNGQTNRSNLFMLDGVNNQGSFGSTYAVAPDFGRHSKSSKSNRTMMMPHLAARLAASSTSSRNPERRSTTVRHGNFIAAPVSTRSPPSNNLGRAVLILTESIWRRRRRSGSDTGTQLRRSEDVFLHRIRRLPLYSGPAPTSALQHTHADKLNWPATFLMSPTSFSIPYSATADPTERN